MKFVLLFFCFWCFGILHRAYICVVHNFLFVCVRNVVFFCIWYAITCLPYFLQWFCALVYLFLLPKCSLSHFLFFAGSCRCYFLTFRVFFCRSDFRFTVLDAFACYSFAFCSLFTIVYGFLIFLTNFVVSFFFNLWPSVDILCAFVLLFLFASPLCFAVSCVSVHVMYWIHRSPPSLPVYFSFGPPCTPQSSLPLWYIFWPCPMHPKSWSDRVFVVVFVLFLFPPASIPPLHQYASIIIHLYPFLIIFCKTHKTLCSRKFPRPYMGQIMSCTIMYAFFCLVFVCPRAPAPHRTHPNPSAPICIHMNPYLP